MHNISEVKGYIQIKAKNKKSIAVLIHENFAPQEITTRGQNKKRVGKDRNDPEFP